MRPQCFSMKLFIQQVVLAYNKKSRASRITLVADSERPWCADSAFSKVERRFYIAPNTAEFRSEKLNDIISRLERLFGSQVQEVVYFFYFHNRLAMGWLDIGGDDNRFWYRFGTLISFTPEPFSSSNRILFFPSVDIALAAYRQETNMSEYQMINLNFNKLKSHGFIPHVHLNKGELRWQEVKDNAGKEKNAPASTGLEPGGPDKSGRW